MEGREWGVERGEPAVASAHVCRSVGKFSGPACGALTAGFSARGSFTDENTCPRPVSGSAKGKGKKSRDSFCRVRFSGRVN